MGDLTQVEYDVLADIEKIWKQGAEETMQGLPKYRQTAESLHGGGWQGQAADKFFEEFSGEILPALERYAQALQQAADTMTKIRQTYSEAEEESQGFFSSL